MRFSEWNTVIDSLVKYREMSNLSPGVTLWGGEPLVYKEFKSIVEYLKHNQFKLKLITNGVLIDRYYELIRDNFEAVHISVDGPREMHDSIRGKGVFDKVAANVKLLHGGNAKIIFMTVISPDNIDIMTQIPHSLELLGPDKIILHKFIYLSSVESAEYKKWLKTTFAMGAPSIDSWVRDDIDVYLRKLDANIEKLRKETFSIPVEYLPHDSNSASPYCLAPFNRVHIAYNGDVLYCTDFYDFKAGNIRNHNLIEIFNNEISEKFRSEIVAGNCPTCRHCSWKNNKNFTHLQPEI
jgi:radical SAM protein with 4Fe4S-binding SPASM domain